MLIDNLEQFLSAYRENPHSSVEIINDYRTLANSMPRPMGALEVQANFTKTLLGLGIVYRYGGSIEVNSMAVRILDIMHSEGKDLSPDNFRVEIEESKKLYLGGILLDASELETHFL